MKKLSIIIISLRRKKLNLIKKRKVSNKEKSPGKKKKDY